MGRSSQARPGRRPPLATRDEVLIPVPIEIGSGNGSQCAGSIEDKRCRPEAARRILEEDGQVLLVAVRPNEILIPVPVEVSRGDLGGPERRLTENERERAEAAWRDLKEDRQVESVPVRGNEVLVAVTVIAGSSEEDPLYIELSSAAAARCNM